MANESPASPEGAPADSGDSPDERAGPPAVPADSADQAGAEGISKPRAKGFRLAAARKVSTNALVVAAFGAVIASITAAVLALYLVSPDQGAANKAVVQGQQEQQNSAELQYAEQVTYGLGTVRTGQNPQLMIFNKSTGWVKDITIIIPIPDQSNNGRITLPGFKVVNGMVGMEQVGVGVGGAYYSFQFPNLPPCEEGITAILSAVPNVTPTELAASELFFTDQKGVGWVLHGDGQLTQGSVPFYAQGQPGFPNGPGSGGWAWSSGADMLQTSCSS
jgi:hypothetical protein